MPKKEARGRLQVRGLLSLRQFWPEGEADADTITLSLEAGPKAFQFQLSPGAPFQPTCAFEKAIIRGRVVRPVLARGKLKVRLQGVDSPEVHYTPAALLPPKRRTPAQNILYRRWNNSYRQVLAETAVSQLRWLLSQVGRDPLPCRVVSCVDDPGEVFDVYGRLVGELLITLDGREVSVNTWLVRQGWAFPAFYSSMTRREITTLLDASTEAQRHRRGVWRTLSEYIRWPNLQRQYRRGSSEPERPGKARLIWPKLFRRLVAWATNKKAKMLRGSFHDYLEANPDRCYETRSFLAHGEKSPLLTLDRLVLEDGFLSCWPQEIVFQEAPCRLLDPSGSPITW